MKLETSNLELKDQEIIAQEAGQSPETQQRLTCLYAAVLIELAILIALFYLFTKVFE